MELLYARCAGLDVHADRSSRARASCVNHTVTYDG